MPAPSRQTGVSDGTMPEVNITREQLVTMFYSYAKLKGMDPIPNGMALSKFRDADFSFSSERNGGKERRKKPMVFGIPFVRSQPRRKKAHAESLLPLSPLPLPRAAGKCRILPPWNSVPPRGT